METSYLTVNPLGEAEQLIQKSRFIGYVKRVESEDAAQSFIQTLKKKHYDANHNCYAYVIGEGNKIQKANDDGEPSGTAGIPMLEILKKQNLRNTVVVATRYFGGVKLGAGGLIRAYGSTVTLALSATGIVKNVLMKGFKVTVDYHLLGKLENELHESNFVLDKIDYLEQVSFYIYVESESEQNFKDWMVDLTSDQAQFEIIENKYLETPIET